MPKIYNLIGQQFGRLTVIAKVEPPANTKGGPAIYWLCKCSCDAQNEVILPSTKLIQGHTKSCGCYQKDMASKSNKTHGLTKTRLYTLWQAMKRRCNNQKDVRFKSYGGRGIKVCDEWLHDFMTFRDWALRNGYNDKLSIDRIDSNGNYEPSNCRWATMKAQQNNKTTSRLIEFNGECHTLSEWAEMYNLEMKVLHARLNKLKWPIEKALTEPLRSEKKHIK